jgi:hypothetical protein
MMENDFNGSTKSGNFQLNSNLISRKSKEFQIKKKITTTTTTEGSCQPLSRVLLFFFPEKHSSCCWPR